MYRKPQIWRNMLHLSLTAFRILYFVIIKIIILLDKCDIEVKILQVDLFFLIALQPTTGLSSLCFQPDYHFIKFWY